MCVIIVDELTKANSEQLRCLAINKSAKSWIKPLDAYDFFNKLFMNLSLILVAWTNNGGTEISQLSLKTPSFVYQRWMKILWVWNNMRVSKFAFLTFWILPLDYDILPFNKIMACVRLLKNNERYDDF